MKPRTRNWLLIFVALALVVLGHRLAPAPELHSAYFETARPMVIAHQGGDGVRPGNTLLAFQHAVDLGVDVLEMDVHVTRDGALVVMHDATVDRTTDGTGALAEMTLAEVEALDAAYDWPFQSDHHPYRGRGVSVPTLPEVLGRFPNMRFNVEIKPDTGDAGRAVCRVLEEQDIADRVLVASFHEAPLGAFRADCPHVPTSGYEGEVRWFYILYRLGLSRFAAPAMAAIQVPAVAAGYELADPELIAAAQRRRLHVDFWTINEPAEMRRLIEQGADGIITDRPDLLLEVLAREIR